MPLICVTSSGWKTQAIRCLSGRFSHRFSRSSIIFLCHRHRRRFCCCCRSELIFKWFNQCNGSSFKSKIILSLQRQISCPYLCFFCFRMHTLTCLFSFAMLFGGLIFVCLFIFFSVLILLSHRTRRCYRCGDSDMIFQMAFLQYPPFQVLFTLCVCMSLCVFLSSFCALFDICFSV